MNIKKLAVAGLMAFTLIAPVSLTSWLKELKQMKQL